MRKRRKKEEIALPRCHGNLAGKANELHKSFLKSRDDTLIQALMHSLTRALIDVHTSARRLSPTSLSTFKLSLKH